VVLELLADQQFLSALAAVIGPLAIFAAPTEEIEHLLFDDDAENAVVPETSQEPKAEGLGYPKAA
jgi:hypothetical protein